MKFIRFLFLLLLSNTIYCQSKLKSAKDSFKPSGLEIYTETYSSAKSSSQNEDTSLVGFLFGEILFQLTLGLVYYTVIESPFEFDSPMSSSQLKPYPFYQKSKGDYTYNTQKERFWRIEISDSYFNETDRLQANDFQLNLRLFNRIGLNTTYLHFWERVINAPNEQMDVVFSTFDYYRFRTPHFTAHWGIGIGYIGNEINEFGFAYSFGTKFFFRPLSIDVKYQAALFSENDARLFEAGPSYHIKQFFIQLKYQNYLLGRENISGFSAGMGMYY